MSNPNVKSEKAASSSSFSTLFAAILIPLALVIGWLVFKFILGDPSHFEDGNPDGHPHPGDYLGMMYKGGPLVPILMATMIIVIAVIIERFITLRVASGKGSIPAFVRKIKGYLDRNDISGAI
ncbi:MAG: MotA/TolQ/ExbB proton channel family protein, partial [Saprospiraceae bacterium]